MRDSYDRGAELIIKIFFSLAFLPIVLVGAAQASPAGIISVAGAQSTNLSAAAVGTADKTATHGLVSADKKTLTFRQRTVRLVARSGPANDMLSYRIEGLRNPTLMIPVGTTLKMLFINTDDDMTHNLRLTVQKIPFKGTLKSVGTANLPHKSSAGVHAQELTLRMPMAGTYTYLCTVPGHAPGGMFGTLIVR